MIKKVALLVIGVSLMTSCVSKKVYADLEDNYAKLKKENRALEDKNKDCLEETEALESQLAEAKSNIEQLKADKADLANQLAEVQQNRSKLDKSYKALEKNSASVLAENQKKNRELLEKLEAKEKDLKAEHDRLVALQKELDARSKRVDELEAALAAKDANMKALKESISKALTNFEGKGLTVEHRDGKVYVSMENKLLFQSGKWDVGAEGQKAVEQLGAVLAENPDINVLIEGHTDDDAYRGSGPISGNWDLSTKRATAIVAILQKNDKINPTSLTAAGRSAYAPIADNDTPEGKAKNRRIEVVLTPKLDEVSKLLNEVK
ncbi:OmpA family protein [Pseudofulvibacter geojedonensis]|uniref:OmpA family protein n=1 Tax=Pseudofulvibacter geojedonensis TaxID=1123758 RepID=A0ABW3I3Y5_9FLAO